MGKKKKAGSLAIGFCLDESGSMDVVRDQTISGVNEYLNGLRRDGETTLSLTMFSSDRIVFRMERSNGVEPPYRVFSDGADIKAVAELTHETYRPDGNTPLFDAVGFTINTFEAALGRAAKQPDAVLFVIQTDGKENASREFTRQAIIDLIARKEKDGWRFVFLGANMDEATAERASIFMGMAAGQSVSYDYGQTDSAFRGVSVASAGLRANPKASAVNLTSTARAARDEAEKRKRKPTSTPSA
jgi:hypothetical protein